MSCQAIRLRMVLGCTGVLNPKNVYSRMLWSTCIPVQCHIVAQIFFLGCKLGKKEHWTTKADPNKFKWPTPSNCGHRTSRTHRDTLIVHLASSSPLDSRACSPSKHLPQQNKTNMCDMFHIPIRHRIHGAYSARSSIPSWCSPLGTFAWAPSFCLIWPVLRSNCGMVSFMAFLSWLATCFLLSSSLHRPEILTSGSTDEGDSYTYNSSTKQRN